MLSIPMFLVLALALTFVCCVVFTIWQIAKAPVGFESDNEFHVVATPTTREFLTGDLVRHQPSREFAQHSAIEAAL